MHKKLLGGGDIFFTDYTTWPQCGDKKDVEIVVSSRDWRAFTIAFAIADFKYTVEIKWLKGLYIKSFFQELPRSFE